MPSLRAALDAVTTVDGAFHTATPDGWTQGRTLYGGMTAALSAHVAGRLAPDLPPLRSAQFSFVGPAAGDLVFRPEILRQGRSATIVGVDCIADGQLAARGVLTYGAQRESVIRHQVRHEGRVAPPEQCEPFSGPGGPLPGFFQNFELRLADGARPFSGPEASPGFGVWIRHVDDKGVDPTIALLALADGLPPAAMVQFPAPAPISTMTWTIDVVQPQTPGHWFLSRSVSEASSDGYSQQAMEVFDEDGGRVAVGRQVVAIFT